MRRRWTNPTGGTICLRRHRRGPPRRRRPAAPPLATTRATFCDACAARCPRPSGTVLAVHVSLGEEGGPPVGVGGACRLVRPLARPAVTSVHLMHVSTTCPESWTVDDTVLTICTPTTTGRARLLSKRRPRKTRRPSPSRVSPPVRVDDGCLADRVGGSNYAPTNTAGEEVACAACSRRSTGCRPRRRTGSRWASTGQLPGDSVAVHRAARPRRPSPWADRAVAARPLAPAPLVDAPPSTRVSPPPPPLAPSRVRCESRGGFSPEGDDTVDLDLRFSARRGCAWRRRRAVPRSDDSRFVTVFDASMAAELTSVDPTFGDRLAPIVLLARGRNLAPTPGLACLFTSGRGAGTVVAAATFVSSRLVKCAAPVADAAAAADPPRRPSVWWARVWRCASRIRR